MYRHLSTAIESNPIFRRLFLYRKVFLTKSSRRYYSQFGEDICLGSLVNLKKKGFYVDVGCYHPTKYSNTFRLYQHGWRGINIDMDSIKVEACELKRPHDKNICVAITDDESVSSMSMYSHGFYALTSTLEKEQEASFICTRIVPCSTLNHILEKESVDTVDLISIDAEGHDLNVLRSIDLTRYSVKTIIVESFEKFLTDVLESGIYQHVSNQGFELVNWAGKSLIFQKRGRL